MDPAHDSKFREYPRVRALPHSALQAQASCTHLRQAPHIKTTVSHRFVWDKSDMIAAEDDGHIRENVFKRLAEFSGGFKGDGEAAKTDDIWPKLLDARRCFFDIEQLCCGINNGDGMPCLLKDSSDIEDSEWCRVVE